MTLTPFNKPVFTLPCPPLGTVRGRTCRKSTFDRIILALNSSFTAEEMRSLLTEISPDTDFGIMGLTGARLFLGEYRNAVEKYCRDLLIEDVDNGKKDNIFSYVKPEYLFVKHEDKPRVAIMCKYRYDMEHGLAVVFSADGDISVGPQDIIL